MSTKKDIKSKDKKASVNKYEAYKKMIIENANALADRVINAAISREEQAEAWAKRKAEVVKQAALKAKEKRNAKIARKKAKILELASTIPFVHCGKCATKEDIEKYNQYIDVHKKKQKEAEKIMLEKYEAKIDVIEVKRNWKAKRKEKVQEERKNSATRKAHGREEITKKLESTRTTKEQRIAAKKDEKKQAFENFVKEQQRIASEKTADPEAAKTRAEKRKTEAQRLQMIAEKRIERTNRIIKESVKIKNKAKEDALRYAESEKARIARKQAKRATYLTKGGIPEVKTKKEIDVSKKKPLSLPNKKDELEKYLVCTQYSNRTDEGIGALICRPSDLKKRIKEYHNRHMDPKLGQPDTYVGLFVKDPKDANKYILEMINDKFLIIDGVSTSRVKPSAQVAA